MSKIANMVAAEDRAFHAWYRFVLSFPPHLVNEYLEKFGVNAQSTLLDPFCGTGTTIVEAKLRGINGIGIEANPVAHLASVVKTAWELDPHQLMAEAHKVATLTAETRAYQSGTALRTLPTETLKLLLNNSISPRPLHRALVLLEQLEQHVESPYSGHWRVAFAKAIVKHCSNLHFGPEVGVKRKKREDAPVIKHWLAEIAAISTDLQTVPKSSAKAMIHHADARDVAQYLQPQSIDAVFTSPPYPNEKDYTRTTRLETVLLGFVRNKQDLRNLKKGLLRSNSRNVYKEDQDDVWIQDHASVLALADRIEARRLELGKTSGFEKKYPQVTRLYFGGMARHLASLRPYLKPGARLGYVVGDQASFLQIMIRTGQLLAEIAESLGYQVESIDLFRTRRSSRTEQHMREEVLVLRWPG
ncbi:MAG: DNA methyltransferase [Cyanobacteria bacterium P01_A01_bin.17]